MLKLQEIAKSYLSQGLNVIPVLPEQKKPAVQWLEFNDRKPNPLEVQSWFAGKVSNIGIVTGHISKIVVIDIDKPELYASFIAKYPTDRVQRTASGGYHLLYRYDGEDIGNSVSRLSSGIDVRGRHGYIVTYPSTVRLSNGTLGEYRWIKEGDILPLPKELHDTIVNELNVQSKDYKVQIQQPDAKDLFYQIVSRGFTEGRHNEEAKDTARYLFRTGMEFDAIVNLLSALNAKDPTPLPPAELMATIKSGIGYEKSRMAVKTPQNGSKAVFNVMDNVDYLMESEFDAGDEWLIDQWLPRNSLIVVTAPPESYKTWIALEAAVQVALGSNSNGFFNGTWRSPDKPEPVLIVQQEDDQRRTAQRIKTIMMEKGKNAQYMLLQDEDGSIQCETIWNAPIHYHTQSALSFDDEASLTDLETKIRELGIKLVVIDPVYSLATAEDFFASMARKLLVFKEMRKKYGVTFIFVHHNKKGTKGAKTVAEIEREGMFGSQLLNGAFEGMWLINKMATGKRVILRTGKSFAGGQEAFGIDFDINTEYFFDPETGEYEPSHYRVTLTQAEDSPLSEIEEKLRDTLQEMIEGNPSQVIEAAGFKKTDRRAREGFDKLVALGIAVVKSGYEMEKRKVYEFAAAY